MELIGCRNAFAITLVAKNMNIKNEKTLMKRFIALSAITSLVAFALVGCKPNNATETPSPNSSMDHDNGMMHGATNTPNMNTNMPASPHQ